ncbi:MAG: response regulator [Deltaproteobacteria bacterium]|nr:response regulator [Deltaproteobacteria bacterium]
MQRRSKILLIDDEPLVREELGELLQEEGFEVLSGSDGQEGLNLFRQHQPDLVITDVRMPRIDGLTLIRTLRRESPTTPVTVITGHGNESMAIDALRAGVVDFLKKPVRIDDLLAALARMETALHLAHATTAPSLPKGTLLREQRWSYELRNERGSVSDFVDGLLGICAADLERRWLMELSLALQELMINAIEHGNLEVTYADKSDALKRGILDTLLTERALRPEMSSRHVIIDVIRKSGTADSGTLQITITDQGSGFDWRALPDPTNPTNLLAEHGRGVMLARLSVDDLSYNENGNSVTAVKRFPSETTEDPQ